MKNKLDDLDLKILRLMQLDARMPLKQVAAILNKAVATICTRIKKMEKMGVIRGSRLQLDLSALGIEAIGCIYLSVDRQSGKTKKLLASELNKIKGVVSCTSITGQASIKVEIAVKNMKSFNHVRDTIASIPNVTVLNGDMEVEVIIPDKGLDF